MMFARIGLALCLLAVFAAKAEAQSPTWEGYQQVNFKVAERNAFLIVPKQAAAGRPWIWRTEFFGHEPQGDKALIEKGFHVAYVDVQNLYGAPKALDAMDSMYAHVTDKFQLSKKVVLEGFSRGGLFALNWAARHPDRVACIYNDAPVCDFKSWPGGRGKGKGSPADWDRMKAAYGFSSDEEALAYKQNPIDNLAPLVKAQIPILHICGADDEVVPMEENSLLVEKRYKELGGSFTLISKPNCGHHPHSLPDPAPIVEFVLKHTK